MTGTPIFRPSVHVCAIFSAQLALAMLVDAVDSNPDWLVFALSAAIIGFVATLTGALTALSNVGPGLRELIGPAGNFSTLSDAAKSMLTAGMLMGRLEIIAVLVLFAPAFWRG